MIIYLYGPDSYRRQKKLKEIVTKYKQKHSAVTMERFDLEAEPDLLQLRDFIKNQSLFDSFKLAIVSIGIGGNFSNDFAEFLKSQLESGKTVLLLLADKELSKEFKFLLKKPVISQNFEELKPPQIGALIRKEAQKREIKLPSEAINSLIRANGSDLWGIMNELDKLELGGHAEDALTPPIFFVLLNRAKRGDLSALTWLLETEEPAKIFNILSSFVKTAEDAARMADYDVAVKSGKLGYEEALLDLVISG
ncbi:MAG: hypothetical protein A3A16_03720 [Candidatus Harrisonbacteria bacterium RIFCSPLOWO2_01_FULL_44_18]|uniref:Uncharacterized protein n=1 Tax=Candidatus Harrisonbacteria bacterium RIFCSPLOWO2_01_FULL_44_18 TaxID=1798407 RepID=A0A1G1ZPB3_9BACT|nr:MAG: hypothetical protein A3A16_03720 [Candidatus Harrisonbacteria bacterium RIFCSPLOWO2_01_FULL_44_18]